jgi:hypothetical protein
VPESLAEKAERIAEAEAQLAGYTSVMQLRRDRIEEQTWQVIEHLTRETEIRRDRYQSIKMFVERLGLHETLDAADITLRSGPRYNRQQFLYFCRVCWNKIKANEAS